MEQARMFIAIGLSFLVFFVWQYFFVEPQQPAQISEKKTQTSAEPSQTAAVEPAAVLPSQASALPEGTPVLKEAREVTVSTPLFTAVLSERGAVFKRLVLKNYRESVNVNSPQKELILPGVEQGNFVSGFEENGLAGMDQALFSLDTQSAEITVSEKAHSLIFTWVSPSGMSVHKKYTFSPDSYQIGLDLTVNNPSQEVFQGRPFLSILHPPAQKNQTYAFEGPSALIDGKLHEVAVKKIEDQNTFQGRITWVALQGRYFMASIIPEEALEAVMRLTMVGDGFVEARYVAPEVVVVPGTQKSIAYSLFMGPKNIRILQGLGHELSRAVDFGMFDFIAKPALWLLNLIYGVIPNYGVAIIILTIFTKILLWPLGNKSYKSMNEMKKLQPLMAEIREKHKDDKKKMNEEMMGLYKTYKINPVGGCLPMVAQIPIFFALYRMLYQAIELRHAPFFLWIDDLSAPDRLFEFGFSIPFMEPPYGIPVLTIIMGATMFLQQKMAPPPGDPTQAKIMMFLPLVFTVIFINFSSGLVLYWLVNNVLSIAQQYYVSKKYV
ncbi:MAG: membrane protein insertase YidC [Desulfobacteraceae bacterium]|jgi:YidC/Oxa1 family membrane protein insertase